MGTVHGVYLKYVGLSIVSYYGYWISFPKERRFFLSEAPFGLGHDEVPAVDPQRHTRNLEEQDQQPFWFFWWSLIALMFAYSTFINALIAILFKLERGMGILGKNRATGQIPIWSYVVFFPFHCPTILYTYVHTRMGTMAGSKTTPKQQEKRPSDALDATNEAQEAKPSTPHPFGMRYVPVATEVQPGWWVGGCYGHELIDPSTGDIKEWGGIIDLTVEFPETCPTKNYLSIPTWDGVPPSPAELERAAMFSVQAKQQGGDILVHCAHGRGRSTTVMCACMVRNGLFSTWEEAFSKGIKPFRPVCKLNTRMRENLAKWQANYVDGKKGQ